ncbi:MAG: hypothetical protein GXZ02_11845 [Clostridiales bacterium]|nr:hypothetical protein [Clostridiales bacterium]
MSFFDDAVSAAKTVGKSVGRRAEEIVIISKKKLEAIELENKLSGLYERLGKVYYLDFEGTADDLMDETEDHADIIDKIKAITVSLDELRTEIENLSKNK